jgi:hypothetical protein
MFHVKHFRAVFAGKDFIVDVAAARLTCAVVALVRGASGGAGYWPD